MADLHTDVRYIKGIGETRAKALAKLGITTLQELIGYFPRRYEDRTMIRPIRELAVGETVCVRAMLANDPTASRISGGRTVVKARAVDESGAMDGEKIQAARDTAILLNEALATVRHVDLYIYGHTTENGSFVKLNAYREGRGRGDKYVLGSIEADWSNIDSRAIREAAARVRARTREKCLFFVISDGAPCEPTRNVKEAVRELSRDGFSFVSIGIDFEYDPSEMYDNHVSMTDLSTLAPELGKMIKKAIMDNSNRK